METNIHICTKYKHSTPHAHQPETVLVTINFFIHPLSIAFHMNPSCLQWLLHDFTTKSIKLYPNFHWSHNNSIFTKCGTHHGNLWEKYHILMTIWKHSPTVVTQFIKLHHIFITQLLLERTNHTLDLQIKQDSYAAILLYYNTVYNIFDK
jgi:hypothetical protein